MTALVTGATGFVGFHVAQQLVARGERPRVLTRPNSRLDNIRALGTNVVEAINGDLTDGESLRQALRGCDILYHVAADYRLWAKDTGELYRANVDGTRQLMEIAWAEGVRKIVYTSTVGALGIPHDGTSGDENTPVSEANMIGHYKRSKFLAEEVVHKFALEGLPVVIVNPSTPVGERDIKPTPTGQIIVDFLNRKMPAYVDTGLNLIDVRDCAQGILLAGECGRIGERYILGHRNTSMREMLTMLSAITGLSAPKVQMPYALAWLAVGVENVVMDRVLGRAPTHPFEGVKMARHKMFFNASKAVRELGLPQSPVEDALRRAVEWFKANGYVTDKEKGERRKEKG